MKCEGGSVAAAALSDLEDFFLTDKFYTTSGNQTLSNSA